MRRSYRPQPLLRSPWAGQGRANGSGLASLSNSSRLGGIVSVSLVVCYLTLIDLEQGNTYLVCESENKEVAEETRL